MHVRILCFACALSVASPALADDDSAPVVTEKTTLQEEPLAQLTLGPRTARGLAALDRVTGIAEAGFGWLTLPGAEVCVNRSATCRQGDTSFAVDVWQIIRANVDWAFGAGILFGLIPTTDVSPRTSAIERDHSRQYLTLEGTARYYPYVGENFEWWVGVTGGFVIVSDRFEVAKSSYEGPILGPEGVTIRTEGATVGLATGLAYLLAPHWTCGASLRYGNWFLPDEAATNPFEDEASLTGRNTMFSLGLNIAYRTAL